ncbi:hypothetical protein IFM89_020476 [Coptis chinensis]|uniref:Uncharacterized protein n=1 Tax=Coptis chinensis TaxID=261450 RepID=A0A835H494_9MAGN|nr:hypothetical protein IFM89_020476 [Coptis chinensis]
MNAQGEKMEGSRDSMVIEKKKGGARTLPFIFSNEVCERLAATGFFANMISYLTQVLHLPLTKSATMLTNFGGTSTMFTFAGAFIADTYAGRFWTITVASVIYLMVDLFILLQFIVL